MIELLLLLISVVMVIACGAFVAAEFSFVTVDRSTVDREADGGMATSVGRLRLDAAGLRYVLVSHNTKMGAAKGAVLTAEHLVDAAKI